MKDEIKTGKGWTELIKSGNYEEHTSKVTLKDLVDVLERLKNSQIKVDETTRFNFDELIKGFSPSMKDYFDELLKEEAKQLKLKQ